MLTGEDATKWFLRLLVPTVLSVDWCFARIFGESATISRVIYHWSVQETLFPYLLALGAGTLFGHLCCPVKPAPLSTPHYILWALVWTAGVWLGHRIVPQHPFP